ncbi:MAG TPA: M3 family oligoendopeptidase, partial [Thermomicrobiales bacterium]|nr:M3 family oligoendopeptidase [Thermomicrobiales bacterium]
MPSKTLTDTAPVVEVHELPRWDLSALFPGLDSPEFTEGFDRLLSGIDDLIMLFDEVGVSAAPPNRSEAVPLARFDRVLNALNDVAQRLESMGSYLYGYISTDSRSELAQARFSQFQERAVEFDKLQTRFTAWVGTLPIEELVDRSALAAEHDFPLRQLHAAARHLMSEEAEALAAELSPSSGAAWAKLHDNLTSQITAKVDVDGREQTLPMSAIRNLAMRPDRDLRRRAWQAELGAWEAHALPIAAALNGVKGEVLTLAARRDWADPLDESLFWSGIDREILDAMVEEARAAFPDFRRYLRLKARLLGITDLAWYDLFAPVGDAGRTWTWPEAIVFIEDQFGAYSDRLRGLARRAFAERWIDAGPRPGKVGGAYCMWLLGDESRILANYSPGYDGVTTLAHELGHAYHNLNEAGLTPLQRRKPMILAETASTFCETLVKEAALVDAGPGEKIYILEQSAQGACQVVVDILSRFDFEQSLFAGRRERELSIGELNRLMLEAQEATYGDALVKEERHPYMWAVKGHYYSADLSYYNYPYLFGLLFGLGLYAIYRKQPETFPDRYDALLASTGRASAADLAARFGIDLRDRAFWRS